MKQTAIPQFLADRIAATKMTTEERTIYMKLTRRIFSVPSTKAVESPIVNGNAPLDTNTKSV